MNVQGFGVKVPEGRELSNGYVVLQHGQTYTLQLSNINNRRCNAEVSIDGQHVGTWRLTPFQVAGIERPADEYKLFTFYATGTTEAAQSGIASGDSQNGVITVRFTPEKIRPTVSYSLASASPDRGYSRGTLESSTPMAKGGFSEGGTGLSGRSNQVFTDAEYMELDYSAQVTINLRLVGPQEDSYIKPLGNKQPLPTSTPIPSPVTR